MFNRKITFAAMTVPPVFLLLALSAGYFSLSTQRADAQEPAKAEAKGSKQKELLKERLAVIREIAKLSTEAYKAGAASYDEVREAVRMVLQAELEQCDSDKDRITVLEKVVAEAKKMEEHAGQLSKTGQAPTRTALRAKADRLQAEIKLEQATTKVGGRTGLELNDQVALAEKQVAIKRAAVKVADAQKKIAVAKLATLRAQVAEAQASESFAEKQVKRFEELVNQQAVTTQLIDERRTQWDAAKARRTAAEGKVAEGEAQVLLEKARVDLAQLEVGEAELRLKQLNPGLERNR
jgi:hypothetical protein